MLSLIFNAFCIYLIIGVGISAYKNLTTRAIILQLFWMAVKWPLDFKSDKSLKK